jgi:hypothetical protein
MGEEASQEQASWERLPEENSLWYGRFWRFVQAGSTRTLLGTVHAEENEENIKRLEAQQSLKSLSKAPSSAWRKAAEQYGWKKRAADYDEAERKRIEALQKAYIDSILEHEFALKHERVKALNDIVKKLMGYLDDEDNVWCPDVKSIGMGPMAQRVDLTRFNAELFAEIRAHLDDIAKEMGERVKKQEVNNKGNPLAAVNVHVFLPD